MKKTFYYPSFFLIFFFFAREALCQSQVFPWPEGKKMALSLSFDDARASNPEFGIPLLNEYGVKATFFVVPSSVQKNLQGWKHAVASGHEMANHSLVHPCSGNFAWSRSRALEDYTIGRMRKELILANLEIEEILGVQPKVFAYPCGLSYVGKGIHTQSYVPLVSELFIAGRGWLDEAPVDPLHADMAQLTGVKMDNMEFEEILPLVESASANGQWLVLAGHETNHSGNQTTYLNMLRKLCEYANDPANGIWIAPVGTVAEYVKEKREGMTDTLNIPEIVRISQDGKLKLAAEKGWGLGPEIKYMPEWKAFGWFTSRDRVEWDVDIPKNGNYEIWMEWSVSDKEAGKEFILEAGNQNIKGKVEKSGSWETFQKKSLGFMELNEGYNRMVFKAAEEFEGGGLLDLRAITLEPVVFP